MPAKRKTTVFLFLCLCSVFSSGFIFSKFKKKSAGTASQTKTQKKPPGLKAKKPEKNRQIILGHPHFGNKMENATLKRHIERQWALKDIKADKAWELLKESNHAGKPIVIAVVDTGIHARHPCLRNQLWTNKKEIPGNNKDDDGNGKVDDIHGWNFVDNNNDIQDRHGHGTHVSGIIAAQGKTASSPHCDAIGVTPYARIMTLKYYKEGSNDENIENTYKSFEYAIENGADIINYSGGGPGAIEKERKAVALAADKNIILVTALGNDGKKVGREIEYYPASYKMRNIIAVQSTSRQAHLLDSSNRIIRSKYWEKSKTQNAPGEGIFSTLPPEKFLYSYLQKKSRTLAATKSEGQIDSPSAVRSLSARRGYGYMTGTSQATAVTTGVVALVKTLYPSWNKAQVIRQTLNTGFGQGTDKIKEATNQGKKLNAYEALSMRGQNVDLSDQTDTTNAVIPADTENDSVEQALKDPSDRKRGKGQQSFFHFIQKFKSTPDSRPSK